MNNANDLKHYGVLGMKWGRRKGSRKSKNTAERKASEDYKKAKALRSKKLYEMSNEEIKTITKRLQLEKSYKEVTRTAGSKSKKLGKEMAKKVGGKVFAEFSKQFINPIIVEGVNFAVKQARKKRK